jgi:hypothetical protein
LRRLNIGCVTDKAIRSKKIHVIREAPRTGKANCHGFLWNISEVHSVNGLNWAGIPPFSGSKFAYRELKSFTYQALVWDN